MPPVWTPSSERIEQANLTAFIDFVNKSRGLSISGYPDLYRWSIEQIESFWPAIWEFCGIDASRQWDRVLENGDRMPGARWFSGARLNFARNLLRFRDERPALIFWNELGFQRRLSYRRLNREVACLTRALKASGIGSGDRVAGYLPNLPETVTAMLAAASLGCVWSSCSPDFGVKAVLDRFGQVRPRALFCVDSYLYAGRRIDCRDRLRTLLSELPGIEVVVQVPYLEEPRPLEDSKARLYTDLVGSDDESEPDFEPLPFDHPLYILFSSGTTGLPKGIVHGAGGTLIQHLKELVLHTDVKRHDRIFYYTTCGWMMWNWLVSSLAAGATVVLYDGSPFHPSPGALFQLAEKEAVTIFGTSAKYLALLEKKGVEPVRRYDLSALRTILSTGSPLAPQSYDYVYSAVKSDVCLSSISGGTDLISCFALGNPIGPVYRGELQVRGLGMGVEVFDETGRPVTGRPGELVCTKPFPAMPVGFWNDPEGEKYRAAYFNFYPGVWRHGDWAELTEGGGLIIYGRSDATLNPGGVRIGTAEIYRQVETLEEVLESIVVGQRWEDDMRIVLFVRLREGYWLDDALAEKIRRCIRENASPHHVPKKIIQVPDIPRTISGKISELAVQRVIHNEPVRNLDALANPEALDSFRDLEELQS